MGSIGIVWEYVIQYGNTKTGMVTKFPNSNTNSAGKILFKFAVKTMFGTDNIPLYLMTQNATFTRS